MTLNELLIEKLPDVMKIMDVEGCWSYKVFAPTSLDDATLITIHLYPGKTKAGKKITVVWNLVSGEMSAT